MRRGWFFSAVLSSLVAFAGCAKKKEQQEHEAAELDTVEIGADKQQVLTGPVGVEPHRTDATYVLVDARNRGTGDAIVTLEGDLVSTDGTSLAPLRRQSLRVPGNGGVRMFALLDKENGARPDATSAKVRVADVKPVDYPPPVLIADGRVDLDTGRAVVRGTVVNTAKRDVTVIVIAGFYDEQGRPMKRPSTKFHLAGGGERGVQFVGPEGSRSAYLFVGDMVY